jgi:glycerophosphoryl diester phosphodiesterase
MPGHTLIIGHRGASRDAPENTLASFRLAFEQGADGVEGDFRLTRDGEVVCLHDDSMLRIAGTDLPVAGATLVELRRLDAGVWKGERWRGTTLPTLSEVLAVLPPGKRLFIELKCGEEIIAPVAAALDRAGVLPEQIRFLSFSAELIRALKERVPRYRACWLTDYRFLGRWRPSLDEVMAVLRESRADGLAASDRAALDRSLVEAVRGASLEIHVWTVDRPQAARRLLALGVDSVITNRPGWLRQALAEEAP